MGHFKIPNWQKGYRYISFEDNLLTVNRQRPIPILLTYDPYNQTVRGKSNFIILGRFAFCVETKYGKEWFHQMQDKNHRYHFWGIENSAICAEGKLAVSLISCPLVGEKGFLLQIKLRNLG